MLQLIAIHKLIDIALDNLFNVISNNFINNNILVGKKYTEISINRYTIHGVEYREYYNNCTITHIYQGRYNGSPVTLFNFTIENGDTIMGCTLYDTMVI